MMYLQENEAKIISVLCAVVFVCMILTIVMQEQRISKIKAEKDLKIVELNQIKEVMANPKTTKDSDYKIVWRDSPAVHMSAMEKEALAQQYELKLADLQAVIDAICARGDSTIEITKTGKQTSEPVYPPGAKQKRLAITAEVFNHDMATLGVVYELVPKWGISLGIAASNDGKIGGACVIRF